MEKYGKSSTYEKAGLWHYVTQISNEEKVKNDSRKYEKHVFFAIKG